MLPSPAMLDHEEKFLFKEEILHLSNAVAEPGILDNVEDLLTDVITSPRFDSEVFTLERSLQVMLGPRAGTTLVGLLTVAPEVFDEVAEVRIPSEVHERLVAWRARFGLAIDNALNFLNNPDGIQGHNFATQVAHVEERRVLQGRLTLVRYNNEPQFFVADASVFFGLVADILERLGPYLEPDAVDAETVARLRDALGLVERKTGTHSSTILGLMAAERRLGLGAAREPDAPRLPRRDRPEPGQDHGQPRGHGRLPAPRPLDRVHQAGRPADRHRGRRPGRRGRGPDEERVRPRRAARADEPGPHPARVHPELHRRQGRRGPAEPDPSRPTPRSPTDRDMLLIEGTGHAGVGAVIGLSNAAVAAMLGAPAVIVSEGGVGRPIDEIVLNKALFERAGVHVAGRHRQQGRPRSRSPTSRGPWSAGWPATASRCSASCRTGRSCPTRPWRWSSRASTARRSIRARTSTRSSAAWRSARWSRSTCSSASGRGALVIVPGDREDVIAAIVHAHAGRGARPAATPSGWC